MDILVFLGQTILECGDDDLLMVRLLLELGNLLPAHHTALLHFPQFFAQCINLVHQGALDAIRVVGQTRSIVLRAIVVAQQAA